MESITPIKGRKEDTFSGVATPDRFVHSRVKGRIKKANRCHAFASDLGEVCCSQEGMKANQTGGKSRGTELVDRRIASLISVNSTVILVLILIRGWLLLGGEFRCTGSIKMKRKSLSRVKMSTFLDRNVRWTIDDFCSFLTTAKIIIYFWIRPRNLVCFSYTLSQSSLERKGILYIYNA